MTSTFWCKHCGKEKTWAEDRNYDVGLFLAEIASFEALGHTESVTPYPICNDCAAKVMKELVYDLGAAEIRNNVLILKKPDDSM